ncbi:hypothetical protein CASFOL_019875 [Castilleja foliolosa]|uniref:CCHC-type domain-containing protein n=1 Tax=Castilleja foliolosa TaxID=1961234 RepID=A0ABD3D023_9LAMI
MNSNQEKPTTMNANQDINALSENFDNKCNHNIEISPTCPEGEHTLIAHILSQKPINMNAFKSTVLKAWNPAEKVDTNLLEGNTMAFIFQGKKDMDKVYNLTWTFRDYQVIIAKWPIEKAQNEINLQATTFWIQAYGIPVAYTSTNTATVIGDIIGKFIKADLNSANQRWKRSLRIQIKLDIRKPLQTFITLACSGRNEIQVEIRYERLTDVCYNCGLLGHKLTKCTSKEGSQTPKFLGPWMKSENTHIKNTKFQPSTTIPGMNSESMNKSGPDPGRSHITDSQSQKAEVANKKLDVTVTPTHSSPQKPSLSQPPLHVLGNSEPPSATGTSDAMVLDIHTITPPKTGSTWDKGLDLINSPHTPSNMAQTP